MDQAEQERLHQQADRLYEQFGRPLELSHRGEYVVISPQEQTVIAPSLFAAAQEAVATFRHAGFAFRIPQRAVATWK